MKLWQMDGKRTFSPFGHLFGQGMHFGSVGPDGFHDKSLASVSWLALGQPVSKVVEDLFLASSTIACRAAWVWLLVLPKPNETNNSLLM